MKLDSVKTLLTLAIALLIGFVCEIIAPEMGGRNWISFGVGFASMAALLLPAMGIKYGNVHRGVSIKVFSWIAVVAVVLTNIIFACFEYKIATYIAVVLLLAVIGWGVIYGMYSAKTIEQ